MTTDLGLGLDSIETVQTYWNNRPCNIKHSNKQIGSIEYFNEVEERKYLVEPHIPLFANFDNWRGKKVLEIGCGTGQLGSRFLDAGFQYQGLDISAEMLAFARENVPEDLLHQQDMRNIQLPDRFDAAIITARSTAYLLHNEDLMQAFQSIKKVLNPGGLLIFDYIDARSFIPQIEEGKIILHEVDTTHGKIKRESQYALSIAHNWCWVWTSKFYRDNTPIGEDVAELRAFTPDEMELFLNLAGFTVEAVLSRPVYAFETKVVIARA
jgi:SAM-dependent methyltransferase